MARGLARYGFDDNPYRHQLNPINEPADRDRFARVANYGQVLDAIDALVNKSVVAKEPGYLLISGGSGSGRTAVARYALAKYREARGIAPERFLIPEKTLNHSAVDVFAEWMIELGALVEERQIDIGDVATKLEAGVIGTIPRNVMNSGLNRTARSVAATLQATPRPAGFGVLLRAIPDLGLFTAALEIFKSAPTIVVATASNTLAGDVDREMTGFKHSLNPIHSVDVPAIVTKRWKDFASADTPSPFNDAGLSAAFAMSYPIEQVLLIVGQVLESRLASFPDGSKWPDAPELVLDEGYIVRQVGVLLRDWRPR
jgi:hypothetical protein